MKVYFISGLGADERAFRHIRLGPAHEMVHLPWIPPLKAESLKDYARRMAQGIDQNQPFALVGLSLGGMVATEIAKAYRPVATILISSISCSSSMPPYYKLAGMLRLHRVIPISFIKNLSWIKRLFSAETGEDKKMLRMMIAQSDPKFIRWAFTAALAWKNKERPENCYHIHGTHDGILPARFTQPDQLIQGAGHLMVLNRAREINEILKKLLG